MKIAVIGATGLVGQMMLKVLEERNFPLKELIPVASEKSVGQLVSFKGKKIKVKSMQEAIDLHPHMALFSAGGSVSGQWAGEFARVGCRVIDNSSYWRMDKDKKLIVPEVNGHVLSEEDYIIANPNCSTIQLVMVLQPLEKAYGLKRVVLSTYQSVTGTGAAAVNQLMLERQGKKPEKAAYAYPIDLNLIPQIDVFTDNGYTKEEMKMVNETRKIMSLPELAITATAVRVPVMGGHSESVNIEFKSAFKLDELKGILKGVSGVVVEDDPMNQKYPMPLYARHKDEVFVGRIRRDDSVPFGLNMWIVADNLRKGAATNAVQIAEILLKMGYIRKDQA